MIIKTNKAGEEFESWPTIEEAAKAIKVSPAVLKKHLKGRPPKLGGFVFKEVFTSFNEAMSSPNAVNVENGITQQGIRDILDPLIFTPKHIADKMKELTADALMGKIEYVTPTPESFDSPPLSVSKTCHAGRIR
jgi:hypothetical protein